MTLPDTHANADRRRRGVALLATLVLPAIVFAALADRVVAGASLSWDAESYRLIGDAIRRFGAPVAAHTLLELAALAGAVVLGLGVLALLRRRGYRELAFLALAAGGMALLDPVLKALFERPPVTPDGSGYSFPSGTAMVSLAVAAAAVVLVKPGPLRWTVAAVGGAVALALGVAVVYLQWHHASDVVAGWCAALAWVSALWWLLFARR